MHATSKPFHIEKRWVYEAYQAIRSNGKAAGVGWHAPSGIMMSEWHRKELHKAAQGTLVFRTEDRRTIEENIRRRVGSGGELPHRWHEVIRERLHVTISPQQASNGDCVDIFLFLRRRVSAVC